jgi:hypothetical protein
MWWLLNVINIFEISPLAEDALRVYDCQYNYEIRRKVNIKIPSKLLKVIDSIDTKIFSFGPELNTTDNFRVHTDWKTKHRKV